MYSLGLNPSDEKLLEMVNAVDGDDDGKLIKKEFKDALGGLIHQTDVTAMHAAFDIFDKDGNGLISAPELRHVMTNLGCELTNEEVDEMIRAQEPVPCWDQNLPSPAYRLDRCWQAKCNLARHSKVSQPSVGSAAHRTVRSMRQSSIG